MSRALSAHRSHFDAASAIAVPLAATELAVGADSSSPSTSSPTLRPLDGIRQPTSRDNMTSLYELRVEDPTRCSLATSFSTATRGTAIEAEWTVPIDWILRLRTRDDPQPAERAVDRNGNDKEDPWFLYSRPLILNGLSSKVRLGRVYRSDDVTDAATSAPQKPFDNQFLSCHLCVLGDEAGAAEGVRGSAVASPSDLVRRGPDSGSAGDDDTASAIQEIERQSWDRKVSMLVQVDPVEPDVRYAHPLVSSSAAQRQALVPRVRRVIEATVSPGNKVVGFTNLIPLKELLRFHLRRQQRAGDADAYSPRSGTYENATDEDITLHLKLKMFVSHRWHDCIERHNLAASHARATLGLVGVRNHGSTCYMNVLLQSLYHISYFRREVMRLTGPGRRKADAALHLQRIFCDLQQSSAPVETTGLLRAIRVNPSIQQDSHEFLSEFFLHRVFKSITDVFSFKVKYVTTCHNVDFTSSSEDTLFELALVAGAKYPTLESAVAREFAKEPISDLYDTGSSLYGKQPASRQMHMVTFPHVLFLHSKRFDHFAKKVHTTQTFPMRLTIAQGHDYLLHSVIVHHGTGVNSGHFTAYVRVCVDEANKGDCRFFHFDDEAVYPATEQEVLELVVGVHWACPSSSAYILVYIDAESFHDATTNFDPIPAEVRDAVAALRSSTPARDSARSPPPGRSSPSPSITSSSMQIPQGVQTTPVQGHSDPLIHATRKPQDVSDMQRVMSVCRHLLPSAARLNHPPRCVNVTVWTIGALRAAMRMLGVSHDLIDLRYATKYFRQEHRVRHPDAPAAPALLWGTEEGALSLLLPLETTIRAVRGMIAPLVDNCSLSTNFSATGKPIMLAHNPDVASKTEEAHLFLFQQRRNGTWRPARPVFDIRDEDPLSATILEAPAFSTPRRHNDEGDTNISGTFTLRKRTETVAGVDNSCRLQPPNADARDVEDTRIGDLVESVVLQHAESCLDIELSFLCVLPNTLPADAAPWSDLLGITTATFATVSPTSVSGTPQFGSSLSRRPSERVFVAEDTTTVGPMSRAASAASLAVDGTGSAPTSMTRMARAGTSGCASFVLSPKLVKGRFETPEMNLDVRKWHCGNSALLLVKHFRTDPSTKLSLLCACYFPLDWTIASVVVFLTLNGYLPLPREEGVASPVGPTSPKLGVPADDMLPLASALYALAFTSQANWSSREHSLFDLLKRTYNVFEEVRPERVDCFAPAEWLSTSISNLGLDHGDVLVIETVAEADSSAMWSPRRRGSSTQSVAPCGGRELALHTLESAKHALVACTVLTHPEARVAFGETLFLNVDLSWSLDALDHLEAALIERLHSCKGPERSTDHRLNVPSPGRSGSEPLRNRSAQTAWWSVDYAGHQKVSALSSTRFAGNTATEFALQSPLPNGSVRILRPIGPAKDVSDVCDALRQSSVSAATQAGDTCAPLTILSSLYPTAMTAMLQWASYLYHPTGSSSSTAGQSDFGDYSHSSGPPSPSSRAGDAPPLFDVSASVALRNGQHRWHDAMSPPPSAKSPRRREGADDGDNNVAILGNAAVQSIATVQDPQLGVLQSTVNRLFVAISTPHHLLTSANRIDIIVTWAGWCNSRPLSRFRLRAVAFNTPAVALFALAAQHVGLLSGMCVSCSPGKSVSDACCGHYVNTLHQLALAQVSSSNRLSVSGARVSAGSEAGHSGAESGRQLVGGYSDILPLWSLILLRGAHDGLTAPLLGADLLVSDLLRILRVAPQCGQPSELTPRLSADLALVMLPNAPMDIEGVIRQSARHAPLGPTSVEEAAPENTKSLPISSTLSVDLKRSMCMLCVCRMDGPSRRMTSYPSLIPASESLRELRQWICQLFPTLFPRSSSSSAPSYQKQIEVLLEVHVPAMLEGLHEGARQLPDLVDCQFWLPRDVTHYTQRLSSAHGDAGSVRQGPNPRGSARHSGDLIPSKVNHCMTSTTFFSVLDESEEDYTALVQRSVKFHNHLMGKSKDGLNPSPSFDLKKVVILFPARLVVVESGPLASKATETPAVSAC